MQINGVRIQDTFAEGFSVLGARVLVTGHEKKWAFKAVTSATGFASSFIGCGAEAGVEGVALKTPDGRPGYNMLVFTRSREDMIKELCGRIGQCVMPVPTTACYDNTKGEQKIRIGGRLRYFGDGYQGSKLIMERRFWRIPVMDGEFLIEDKFSITEGLSGNFMVLGADLEKTLHACEMAIKVIRKTPGVITPFPGGIVRSGSKVGSRYHFLRAATNTAYCPSIRGVVESNLPADVN